MKKIPVLICHHWLCSFSKHVMPGIALGTDYKFIIVKDLETMIFNRTPPSYSADTIELVKNLISLTIMLYFEMGYVPVVIVSAEYMSYVNHITTQLKKIQDDKFQIVFVSNTQSALQQRLVSTGKVIKDLTVSAALNAMYTEKVALLQKGYKILEYTD